MSTIIGTPWPPGPPPEPPRPITVEQYHTMIDAGILTEDDPVELLDGILVEKMPKKSPHRVVTGLTRDAVDDVLPAGWYVDSQEPITTSESEPEPDVYAARGKRRDYLGRHPGPGDVGFLVEVADSSLARDRGPKKRIYARARFPFTGSSISSTGRSKFTPIPRARPNSPTIGCGKSSSRANRSRSFSMARRSRRLPSMRSCHD